MTGIARAWMAVAVLVGGSIAEYSRAATFSLTSPGQNGNSVTVGYGKTFTVSVQMNAGEIGNTFEVFLGYDVSSASEPGLAGAPTQNKLVLQGAAADVAGSINPAFGVYRSAKFATAREAGNAALGGRPYGLKVVGARTANTTGGTMTLFSATFRNMMNPGESAAIVISNAGSGASYTTAWKHGIASNRGGYVLNVVSAGTMISGDANRDGMVSFEDFAILQNNYGRSVTGDTWAQGDFNGDGRVDFADFALLQNHYGEGTGGAGVGAEALAVDAYNDVTSAFPCLPLGLALVGAVLLGGLRWLGPCRSRRWRLLVGLMGLTWTAAAPAEVIFTDTFSGPTADYADYGWHLKQGWELNPTAGRAEYNVGAANGWQWIEKSFDPALAAGGWALDFDYEWQWGDHAPWCKFRAEVLDNLGGPDGARDGYVLTVLQGNRGGDTFYLQRVDGNNYASGATTIASGVGYDDAGCQWGNPVWKTVRLTWDPSTHTLKAYKKVNGAFVEVLSAVDTTFSTFANVRFNETSTAGEKTWITNVKFQSLPVDERIIDNFTGPGTTFSAYGWFHKQGWTVNNTAGRVEYNVAAASGWQWFEKSFTPSLAAAGWQLDFDYEWQWGSHSPALRFIPQVVTGDRLGNTYGYGLIVRQGGAGSIELVKLTNAGGYDGLTPLAIGNGYDDAGCGFNPPNWKTVRLTWDNATHTLTVYKKVNGAFVQIASAVDTTYSTFEKVRFNMLYTGDENLWITNVKFQSYVNVPVQGTVTLNDFVGDKTTVPVTIEIHEVNDPTALESHTVVLDPNGHYSFSTYLNGPYDVSAKAGHWLRQKQLTMITQTGGTADFSLINGDADEDNEVTSTDLSIVLAGLTDPSGDLDEDGAITSADVSIVVANMDLQGEWGSGDVVTGGDAWRAFDYNLTVQPGSVMDFSFLNDAPAGKYGRVIASPDGHFVFAESPNTPVRFMGVNLCYNANFPADDATADQLATNLARAGYNAVRFHHFDAIWDWVWPGAPLNATELDKLDRFVARLKEHGIYFTIDLYSCRVIPNGVIPEITDERGYIQDEIKALVPILDSAFDNWAEYTEKLLTHVNPYTGLAWKDEPAMLGICLLNENNLSYWWAWRPYIQDLYRPRFYSWCAANGISSTNPQAFNRFLAELQRDAYVRCRDYIRSLGCQTLVTDINFQDNVLTKMDRPYLEYVDNHAYGAVSSPINNNGNLPYQIGQTNDLTVPAAAQRGLFPTRVFGKPFTVTEYNESFPQMYRSQLGLKMGAYAALQDWDGLYRFAYSHTASTLEAGATTYWELREDPINVLSDRICALLFRRGDVQPATQTVPLALSQADIPNSDGNPVFDVFTKLGLRHRLGQWSYDLAGQATPDSILYAFGIPASSPLPGGVPYLRLTETNVTSLLQQGLADPNWITSVPAQVAVNPGLGEMTVVTSKTEAFAVGKDQSLAGNVVSVRNRGGFSTVCVSAMDGNALASSEHILILHLTDSANTGTKFQDAGRTVLEEWGTLPHLVRVDNATVRLNLPAGRTVTAWAVNPSGGRLNSVPVTYTDGAYELTVNTNQPGGGCMAYELTVQ